MKPAHIKRGLKSKVVRLSFSLLTSSIFCVAFLCLGDAQPSAAQDDTQTSELYKLQAAYLWSAKTLSDPCPSPNLQSALKSARYRNGT